MEARRPRREGPQRRRLPPQHHLEDPHGTFDYDGTTYTVTVEVDRVDFRNGTTHKEDVVPESHKVSVTPEFPGAIKTEFSGPGLETFGADETIQGTWKVGYGSTAPSGSFTL